MPEPKTFTEEEVKELITKNLEKTTAKHTNEINNLKKDLEIANATPEIKEQFLKAGGNKQAFSDLFKMNKDKLLETNDLKATFKELKKEKGYMFLETPAKGTENNIDLTKSTVSEEINKAPTKTINSDNFYPGTPYKKPEGTII